MIKFCLDTPDDFENIKFYKHIQLTKNQNQEIFITKNIMYRLMNDKTYFFTENFFKINFIEFNNLKNYNPININIECLFEKNTKIGKIKTEKIKYIDDMHNQERDINNNYNKNTSVNDFLKGIFSKLIKEKIITDDIIYENDKSFFNNKLLNSSSYSSSSSSSSFYNKDKDLKNQEDLDVNSKMNSINDNNLNDENNINNNIINNNNSKLRNENENENEKKNEQKNENKIRDSNIQYFNEEKDNKEKHLRMVIIFF